MTDSPSKPTAPTGTQLSEQQRRDLNHEALQAVRWLTESLEQPGGGWGQDAADLLARVQAAVAPLRASASSSASATGTLTLTGTASGSSSGTAAATASLTITGTTGTSGSGTAVGRVTIGVRHEVEVHDTTQVQDSASAVVIPKPAAAAAVPPPPTVTVTAFRSTSWSVDAPEDTDTTSATEFVPTADDVPILLLQVLLALDDMAADQARPSYGQVYDRVVSTLGLLLALTRLLRP